MAHLEFAMVRCTPSTISVYRAVLACQQGAKDLDLVASDGIEGFGGPLGSDLFSGCDLVQGADGVGGIVNLGQGAIDMPLRPEIPSAHWNPPSPSFGAMNFLST
jgi:hypothetical protein